MLNRFAVSALLMSIAFSMLFAISCNQQPSKKQADDIQLFLDEDLEVKLWAESPLFHNPTNIDVDTKGRIWVAEAVNYRNFNHDTTRMLHRAEGDRIMILEDTNNDAKADISKVFVQDKDLVAPLGIAVIGNKVYVSCSPRLIVYTDTNGDDKPDQKEILLNGFGGFDHDHGLHAVVGGPDDLLYLNAGNAGPHIVTDKSGWTMRAGSLYTGGTPYNLENEGNQKSDDGHVYVGGVALAINKSGKHLQVKGHNFRNAYELAIDSRGDMWQNDNDDQVLTCRTTWLMENGNAGYFSEDGTRYWQADQRPWQSTFAAHWHQDDPGVMPAGDNSGAGSPTGVVFNEGDALGEKYRGMLLSADAGRNVIFAYKPMMKGSGYDLGERTNFVTSLQKDNVNYVWNDSVSNSQEEKWFRPSDVTIGTDGAIYISDWYDPVVGGHQMNDGKGYGRIYRVTAKGKSTPVPHFDLSTLEGQLKAFMSSAVNVRHTALGLLVKHGDSILDNLQLLFNSENEYHRYRTIWLMSKLGVAGKKRVEELLRHDDVNTRVVAYRALRKTTADILPYANTLAGDSSPFVRREVAVSLDDVPYNKSKKILLQLAKNFDGEDRWYLETIGRCVKGNEEDFYYELVNYFKPDAEDISKWDKRYTAFLWRLHPASSIRQLAQWAKSASDEKDKIAALTALSFVNTKEAANMMLTFANSENKLLAEHATYWLNFRHGNNWYALLNWEKLNIKKAADTLLQTAVVSNELSPADAFSAAEISAMEPDIAAGKKVFASYCASCHRFGDEGKNIGPELSAIGSKFDLKTLLESIIAPSAGVVFGYEPWLVTTEKGDTYYGFLMGENAETIVVKDLAGIQHVIPVKEVKSKKKQDKSPMPDPYSLRLTKEDLANVAGYLQTAPR